MLKKLRSSLLLKFTGLLFFTLTSLYLISYALTNKFLIQETTPEKLAIMMPAFNEMWSIIAMVFVAFFIFSYFVLRFIVGRITQEIDDINDYLEEINKKNYDAVLKIEHHLEFLKLSLLLKNIVKRLKNKKK